MMPYQLLVWDFDGTLADTMALAVETYNTLAAKHGYLPIGAISSEREMGALTFLRTHGIPLLRVPWLVKEYLSATSSRMQDVRLFDGLPDLLRRLKERGYRMGVLSSNSAENIQSCLRGNDALGIFEFVVGYPRLFGKAVAINRLIKKERIDRRCVLYIGDEVRDMEAARKAGVDCAAVGWGFNSRDVLAEHAPRFFWSSPADVRSALLETE
jgi:phosphoglycolate phosphatase